MQEAEEEGPMKESLDMGEDGGGSGGRGVEGWLCQPLGPELRISKLWLMDS